MAELLVCLRDAGDDAMSWKPGYPVVVMPDGHEWGREECPPKFFVAAFPGVSVEDLVGYLRKQYAVDQYQPSSSKLIDPTNVTFIKARNPDGEIEEVTPEEVDAALKDHPDSAKHADVAFFSMPDGLYACDKVEPIRRCEWQFELDGMDEALREKIQKGGRLTVGVGGKAGDVDWDTLRGSFRNDRLGIYERRVAPRG